MPSTADSPDVVVVGGGIIGLAVAWRARERGLSVTLLDRVETGRGASRVAAGMLAPAAEVEFGEAGRRLLELGLRSAQMWPRFAAELGRAGGGEVGAEHAGGGEVGAGQAGGDEEAPPPARGVGVGLLQTGTLFVARDDDDARELERQIAFRDSLGLETTRLRPSEARELEPALVPSIRLALELPDDHSVDPRLVLSALRRACESAGVRVREHAPVERLSVDGASGRVTGVLLGSGSGDGELLPAGRVVLAAGAWTGGIEGLPARARMPVRPVRGQILRLRDPAGPGLLGRVVRFERGYLVPRADGRYVLGATVEERGFDLAPAVGGVHQLLRDAHRVVPGVSELEIEELCVGLRPGTPDNAPMIGPGALDGLIWATGHYRNGILLAPLTAALVADVLAEQGSAEELLATCSPRRFSVGIPAGGLAAAPAS